jgi:hypothetical protein
MIWIGHPSGSTVVARTLENTEAPGASETGIGTMARFRLTDLSPPPRVADLRMIELLVIACRRDNCREVSLLYDAYQVSLMTCMVMGQHEAARWQASNPAWTIRRWSCRVAQTTEKTV